MTCNFRPDLEVHASFSYCSPFGNGGEILETSYPKNNEGAYVHISELWFPEFLILEPEDNVFDYYYIYKTYILFYYIYIKSKFLYKYDEYLDARC